MIFCEGRMNTINKNVSSSDFRLKEEMEKNANRKKQYTKIKNECSQGGICFPLLYSLSSVPSRGRTFQSEGPLSLYERHIWKKAS